MPQSTPVAVLRSSAILLALCLGASVGACDKKGDAELENPAQATCEEDRDLCRATCIEDCEERTYCEKETDTILAECTTGCEDTYTQCIL